MKKLILSILRDLGIFAVIGAILLFFVKPWETALSLLITAYAVIEIIRILFHKDIPYSFRRWPIVTLFIIDIICAHFLLKGSYEKFQYIKICGMLLVMFTANLQLKEEKKENIEPTETEADAAATQDPVLRK